MTDEMISRQLLDFVDQSPSCYHAAANVMEELRQAGYAVLEESEPWQLKRGGRYAVMRGDSSLIAFRIPEEPFRGFMIAAAHSDSPSFKVRETAELPSAGNCLRLSVEPYGGMVMRSWMDRPLSVAGRVMVRRNGGVVSRLVNLERDLLIIPSVAIHMDREVNKGTALKANVDLPPLFAEGTEQGEFRRLIAEAAGVEETELLAADLYLYPRTKGTVIGARGALIAAPRLDDLQCVFGCLRGFLSAKESGSIPVLAIFNHEEVGSGSRQGADSTFLTDALRRICIALQCSEEQFYTAAANSFLVSADNAHAIHPAHPEYADSGEAPVLNGGVVMKYNAAQRYTTDAFSAAVFTEVCQEAGVPLQRYSNRADLPGGSTLGNISSAHFSVPGVDIGLAQLAMHSAYEVAGSRDTAYLIRAMETYFSKSLQVQGNEGRMIGKQ